MIQALLAAHLVAISTDTLAAGDRGLGWFGWFEAALWVQQQPMDLEHWRTFGREAPHRARI